MITRRRRSLVDTLSPLQQLARGKDASKSSKKNKDSKDGTSSPSSRDSSNQSPVLTPTSSSTTLNDIRNKPLPNNTTGHGDHGVPNQPSNPGQQASLPDRFGPMGGASSPNGGNVSSRLPPTVVISPTPGVSTMTPMMPPETAQGARDCTDDGSFDGC
jgi:serine/threonine-protein phosphatase 2A regulatory subunit B'